MAATSSAEFYPIGRVIEATSLTAAGAAMVAGFVAHFEGLHVMRPDDDSLIGSNSPANIGFGVLFIANLLTAFGQNISDLVLSERSSLNRPSRGERVSAMAASILSALTLTGYTVVLADHDDHSNMLNQVGAVTVFSTLIALAGTSFSRIGFQRQRARESVRARPTMDLSASGGNIQGDDAAVRVDVAARAGETQPLIVPTRTAADAPGTAAGDGFLLVGSSDAAGHLPGTSYGAAGHLPGTSF